MQLSRRTLELQELFLQNHSSPQCELRWLSIAGILIKINLVNTMHWNALNVNTSNKWPYWPITNEQTMDIEMDWLITYLIYFIVSLFSSLDFICLVKLCLSMFSRRGGRHPGNTNLWKFHLHIGRGALIRPEYLMCNWKWKSCNW